MMVEIVVPPTYYDFSSADKTISFYYPFNSITAANIKSITNVSKKQVIFDSNMIYKNSITVSGGNLTFNYSGDVSDNDILQVIIDNREIPLIIENARRKFRDGFVLTGSPDPSVWDIANDNSHIINQGGDSSSSSYVRLSLDPLAADSEVSLTSKDFDLMPFRVGFGVTISQRILGQEISLEMIGVDLDGSVRSITPIEDKAITGLTIVIASNVGTITLANHGFKGGDRVVVYGCPVSSMNVGPAVVTVVDANTFTLPITASNGSYNCVGGCVKWADPLGRAFNGMNYLFENTNAAQASTYNRRNGSSARGVLAGTVSTTAATQANTSPYTDAFVSASNFEFHSNLDEVSFRTFASDGLATAASLVKRTQGVPDHTINYKMRIRAKNQKNFTVPVAQITAIAKTGTTTATVTTDVPHGLTTSDFVQIYGVRDQTNFPNLTAATAVASVVDATHFTVVIGTATTNSSAGGCVYRVQGGVLAPGIISQVVQSIVRMNNVLTVIGSATWAGLLPGEYVTLYGLDGPGVPYNGAYKVLRLSTTSLELESVGDNFTSITCGGAVIKRTDVRLHFVRVLDYTRLVTEVVGGRGNTSDVNNAVPVSITGAPTITISGGVTPGTGVNTTAWNAAGWGGFLVNDVASAALTSSATTTATTPGSVANVGTYAHSFNVVVTAVSGTTPTLDIGVEESVDNGTNWVRIYDFERITANGAYTSPLIRSQYGTRFRYVQTVGGTSPSFTRAINRNQFSSNAPLFRRFIDRSIAPNTASSNTPTYNVEGCTSLQLIVSMGAITTTAPQFTLYGSEDGSSWYAMGTALTSVASSTVAGALITGYMPKFVRATVTTQGSGATLAYVAIKALGE